MTAGVALEGALVETADGCGGFIREECKGCRVIPGQWYSDVCRKGVGLGDP